MNLSECYNGIDQFMREVMRVANQFETWACLHVDFANLNDVWPYLLQDRFGEACLALVLPSALAEFDDTDCLCVTIHLRLPILFDEALPLPINVTALNPISGSPFREFKIQTIRYSNDGEYSVPYSVDDDPYDEEFNSPNFVLFGIGERGLIEHIAERATYTEVVRLVRKLAPGVAFPDAPMITYPNASPQG